MSKESTPCQSPYRYRLTIAYDGTAYAGWQVQPGKTTIQSELERCLETLNGAHARVHCSGRTDAGVHARAQEAHVDLLRAWDPRRLQRALNGLLADDIRLMRVRKATPDFHARYDAVGKEYRYHIWNGEVLPPMLRHSHLHVRQALDAAAMNAVAKVLVGEHDFAAFSANPKREIDGTVRTIYDLNVRKKGHELTVVAHGSGFLYKMVRSLAGYLVRAGQGKQTVAQAHDILASKIRTARVPTAPPQGLTLWKVFYG
jgi:tRNA pseudouridine38-40 synthase